MVNHPNRKKISDAEQAILDCAAERWDDVRHGVVQGIPADAADRIAADLMHRGVSRVGPVIEVCTDLLARARA